MRDMTSHLDVPLTGSMSGFREWKKEFCESYGHLLHDLDSKARKNLYFSVFFSKDREQKMAELTKGLYDMPTGYEEARALPL